MSSTTIHLKWDLMAGCITESDQISMRYTSWWSLSGVPHSKSTISGRFTELCIPAYTNRKSWQNIDFGCVHHCERIKIWTFVFPRIHGSPKITGFKNTNRSVLLNGRKCVCRYTLYVQCICTQQWLLYIYPLIHSSFSFES
jgi:hypothetical protein